MKRWRSWLFRANAKASWHANLVGFSIAGNDKVFVWANAKIDGSNIVVWSDSVKKPVAVRYAWANNPECNLYNQEGIPASPFRTDDWITLPVQSDKGKK